MKSLAMRQAELETRKAVLWGRMGGIKDDELFILEDEWSWGIAKVEPCRSADHAAEYITKYLTMETNVDNIFLSRGLRTPPNHCPR